MSARPPASRRAGRRASNARAAPSARSEHHGERAWIAWGGVAVLALAVRLIHLWAIRRSPLFDHLVGDGRAYDAWAQQIAAGDWVGSGVFYQAPLYPYVLAVIYACCGHDLVAVRVVQAVLGAAACVLLGSAGSRFFCRRIGLLAAVLLAVWPSAFFADGLLQKSALDLFFICALLAALARAVRGTRPVWWLATGIALGLLALTRENALVFMPILLAVIAVRFRDARWVGGRGRAAAAFVCGMTAVLLPVSARNWAVGGEFHLTTAQFGPNFYIGNNPAATGMYRPLRAGRGDPRYEQLDATQLAEHAVGRALTPREVSSYWTDRAVSFIGEQPGRWLGLLARKSVLFVNRIEVGDAEDQYTYGEWSVLLALLGRVLHFGLLVPLAAAGIVLTWPKRRETAVLLALVGVYALSVIATFVMARYRHPALPLLILFAAAALVEAVRHARARRWRPLIRALAVAACVAVPANWPLIAESTVRAGSLYNLARSLEDEPRGLDQAIAYYRQALVLDPGDGLAENNLGTALQQRGELAAALPHLRRAVELEPERGEFHYNLAGALAASGDTAAATASYARALAINPHDADAHTNFGVLLHRRGALDDAIQHYTAALTIDPRHVPALSDLGAAYAQQGQMDLAIQSWRSALAVDPNAQSARANLATALAASGRTNEAIEQLRAALRAAPDSVDALVALTLLLAGDASGANEAVALGERARALAGTDRLDVAEALAAAYAASGRWDAAVAMAAQAVTLAESSSDQAAVDRLRDRLATYRAQAAAVPPARSQ